MADIKCPRCGSKDISTSSAYKVKKGLGYAAEFATGFGLQYYAGDVGGTVAKQISIADKVGKEWECNNCHLIWKDNENVRDIIPDAFIQQYKNTMVKTLMPTKAGVVMSFFPPSISALITYGCWFYCHTHEAYTTYMAHSIFGDYEDHNYSFMWYFLGFLMIVFGIVTIVVACIIFSSLISNYEKAKNIEEMTLEQFKASEHFKEVVEAYKNSKK